MIGREARAAHARADLPDGLRYGVVRLAELLDPVTPFALAGCSYCDPLSAVDAFDAVATACLEQPDARVGTALAASQLLSDALTQEVNLRHWYPGDLIRLTRYAAEARKVPATKTVGDERRPVPERDQAAWARQKLAAILDGSLRRFRAAAAADYRTRLLGALSGRLCGAPASEREWAELDHDLCFLAALLLGQGRDGSEAARALATAVARAAGAAEAISAVHGLVLSEPREHRVGITLEGVLGVSERLAAAHGLEPGPDATTVVARVLAWGPEEARVRGLLQARALTDLLTASSPGSAPRLNPDVVVIGPSGRARRVATRAVAARDPGDPPAPALRPFLSAAARARAEAAPDQCVLHAWVALEQLARDSGAARPASLAGLAGLAGVHDLWWAGGASARGLAGPFAVHRLETLRLRFSHGARLAKAAEAVQVRALITINRLKLARHLALHVGRDSAAASPALALAGLKLLDSSYLVLRHWARPDAAAGQAVAEARAWHDERLAGWRRSAEIEVEPTRLVHPG